jgi:hypothetical protein
MSGSDDLLSFFPPPDVMQQCPRCGGAMRIICTQEAYFYQGVHECTYSCECGETNTRFRRAAGSSSLQLTLERRQ